MTAARKLQLVTASAPMCAHDPTRRGYHAVYRPNEVNHCPGCGRVQWYLGRLLAECAWCGTAVPFEGVRI